MGLRKFKSFIRDRQKRVLGQVGRNVLEEQTDDSKITDAATVIIGSELSASERESLRDGLVNDIRKMSESGRSIIAIAMALK